LRLGRIFAAVLINLFTIATVIGAGGQVSFGAPAEPVDYPLRYKRMSQADTAKSNSTESNKETAQVEKEAVAGLLSARANNKTMAKKRLVEVLSIDVIERIAPVAANMPVIYPVDRNPGARPEAASEGERIGGDSSIWLRYEKLSSGNKGFTFETRPEAQRREDIYVAGSVIRYSPQSSAYVDTSAMQFRMAPDDNLILRGSYQGTSGSDIGLQNSAGIGFETGQAMRERGLFLAGNIGFARDTYNSSQSTNLSLDVRPIKQLLLKADYNGQSFNGMESNTTSCSLEISPEFAAKSRITALGRVTASSGEGIPSQKQTELWLSANPGKRLRLAANMQRSEMMGGWETAGSSLRADYNMGQRVQLAAEMNNSRSGSFSQNQQWIRVAAQPGNNTFAALERVRRSYNGGEKLVDGRAEISTVAGAVGIYARMNSSEISRDIISKDQVIGLQTTMGGGLNLAVDRSQRSMTGTESINVTGVKVKGKVVGNLEAQYGMEWVDSQTGGGGSYLGLSGQPVKGVNLSYKRRLQDQQLSTVNLPLQELSLATDIFSSGNALQVRGGVSYLQQEKGKTNWLNADLGLTYKPSANINLSAVYKANVQSNARFLDPGLKIHGEVRWEF
jgi:hypothetical protein